MLGSVVETLIDLLVPPRETDKIVRALTLDELLSMQGEDALPYRDERIRALVWEIKYFANKKALELAGALLAEECMMIAQEEIGKPLLIPIPMHPARRRERGHNQTELLSEAALKALHEIPRKKVLGGSQTIFSGNFDYAPRALERIINTDQQQGLERTKRLKNLKNSMHVVNDSLVRDRVCIVIDDVMTTGATFAEAKRALKKAKARRIYCVAVAKAE